VLRMNGMNLIDEGNNLVITTTGTASRLAPVVGEGVPLGKGVGIPPITTQVFRVNHHAADRLASLLSPLLSKEAILEASTETGHLIMTDMTQNIEEVAKLLALLDSPGRERDKTSFVFVRPQHIRGDLLIQYLQGLVDQLHASAWKDESLMEVLSGVSWSPTTHSLILVGVGEVLERAQSLIETLDQQATSGKTTPYLYTPQGISATLFQKEILSAAQAIEGDGLADPDFIDTMRSARLLFNGKTLLFVGNKESLKKLHELIEAYQTQEQRADINHFYLYRPIYHLAAALAQEVREAAAHMETAGFVDSDMLQALRSGRTIAGEEILLFTGNQEAIDRIKGVVQAVDIPKKGEKKVMKSTTFRMYKVLHAEGSVLVDYLRRLALDYRQNGSNELELIKTLSQVSYSAESHSLIFVGTEEAIAEAEFIAQQFDVPGLVSKKGLPTEEVPKGIDVFLLYRPKNLGGEKLIEILGEFEDQLVASGVHDPHLFQALHNVKWMSSTSNLLITGESEDAQRVLQLLERFDVPGRGQASEDSINSLSGSSLLVYKVQYHSGKDLVKTIKGLGNKLKGSQESASLSEAISGLEYLETTNSLIATGSPDVLESLKEMFHKIDVPMKQVFVEVLVVETTLNNSLNFGLRWGSQGNYRGKFSYGGGAFPANSDATPDLHQEFNSNLRNIQGQSVPVKSANSGSGSGPGGSPAGLVPFSSGFDLGIIGNMILHKGASYFSLGSLVDAVRLDGDTSIVLNQKIITQDNKESSLFIGQNLPYAGALVNNAGNSTVTTTTIEYRNVGVDLKITPTVGNDDVITLAIQQDISETTANSPFSSDGTSTLISGISTDKSFTKTVVTVPDKSFLAISGQIQTHKSRKKMGVPCLGGLPWIGAAFNNRETMKENSSLIIFLRPHLIKGFDIYEDISKHQEEIYREQGIESDFDDALALVLSDSSS
ncbi:MAG: secretin N-terminal domain-containing protein, partial [Chlamydiota bacterium]|nr:secretin N-terminal domain-containing protein [Chlamydiota bacterium]